MTTLEHHRVLYAEDNEDARFMVTTILGFSDIKITTAKTINEAWQLGQKEDFDLYLLETRFSDGSGLDLCRKLREYAPHKPILFYSADAFESDVQKGLAAGADAYLTKPFVDDLAVIVQKAIKNTKNTVVDSGNNCSVELQK